MGFSEFNDLLPTDENASMMDAVYSLKDNALNIKERYQQETLGNKKELYVLIHELTKEYMCIGTKKECLNKFADLDNVGISNINIFSAIKDGDDIILGELVF